MRVLYHLGDRKKRDPTLENYPHDDEAAALRPREVTCAISYSVEQMVWRWRGCGSPGHVIVLR